MNSSDTYNPNDATACAPIRDRLTAYLLGDLAEAEQIEVRTHVNACESCRAAVAEIEPTLDLLRDALVAPAAQAPALSAASRARVLSQARLPVPSARLWLVQRHPWMTAAAAACLVGGFILLSISSMVVTRSASHRALFGAGGVAYQAEYGDFPATAPEADETVVEEPSTGLIKWEMGGTPAPEAPQPAQFGLHVYDANGRVSGQTAPATVTPDSARGWRRSGERASKVTAVNGFIAEALVDTEDAGTARLATQLPRGDTSVPLFGDVPLVGDLFADKDGEVTTSSSSRMIATS